MTHRLFIHQQNDILRIENGVDVVTYETVDEFLLDEPDYAVPAGITTINYEVYPARTHFTLRMADGRARVGVIDPEQTPNDLALVTALDGYIDKIKTYLTTKEARAHPLFGAVDVDDAKDILLAQLSGFADQKLVPLVQPYGMAERTTWERQHREALAYQADPSAQVPVLHALVRDGETVAQLAKSIINKANDYSAAVAEQLHIKRTVANKIKDLTTITQLQTIDIAREWNLATQNT